MFTVIVCAVFVLAGLIFAAVNWLKGNNLYALLGAVCAFIFFIAAAPTLIDLAENAMNESVDGFFNNLTNKINGK